MDLFGSNVSGQIVGLRLLLSPLSSTVVARTACCTVGIAFPVYSTFKAIEKKDQEEQHRWLVYWAAYGSFSLAEALADKILYWDRALGLIDFPGFEILWVAPDSLGKMADDYMECGMWRFPAYYHVKLAFLVWLQLPSTDGSSHLYTSYLRPFLLRHQAKLDKIVRYLSGEMAKFMSANQAQFQLALSCCSKVLTGVRDIVQSETKQVSGAIEGPTTRQAHDSTTIENSTAQRQTMDSESNHEE